MKTETMIFCDCGHEAIRLEYDEKLVYFSFWKFGQRPYSRLQMIWRILTKGSPYGDQLVLNSKGMYELETTIQKYRVAAKQ